MTDVKAIVKQLWDNTVMIRDLTLENKGLKAQVLAILLDCDLRSAERAVHLGLITLNQSAINRYGIRE